ncbi:uncharacterized protein AB675_7663 [Cyphellophora attinorum]|uniref:HIRA-interacting protein 3 n=1 Tax=Cyphellophora attinorum TaxID=1664694 RepID=A0A0N1HQM8_9EURO|nr:uncharacterized protein AB675_7663 [Phialophora attinorum]KPI40300.1 hypothetical protein AB675_7663 [Phialophora attinorum]
MSDSDLSDAPSFEVPPDFELENSLRREFNRAHERNEDPTLRTIRAASEKKLRLPEGFYKGHTTWNQKSKEIVHDQAENEKEVPSSPELKSKSKANAKAAPPPRKRKSTDPPSPAPKKRKTEPAESDDSDRESSALSDADSEGVSRQKAKAKPNKPKAAKVTKAKPAASAKKNSKAATVSDDDDSDDPRETAPSNDESENAESDSEMSVVLDEDPKPKRKPKTKSTAPKGKSSKPAWKPAKSKSTTEDDPDQAEIKRLQGWLVKCGVRKVWGAYLKPYETPKAKIKHLKELLADVGMTGRYSVEKAASIKEARELAEDLSAVQEGDQRWGTAGKASSAEDTADEKPKSKGRLQRGRAHYDFLSSDGEETS